jgi:hypothetical protein
MTIDGPLWGSQNLIPSAIPKIPQQKEKILRYDQMEPLKFIQLFYTQPTKQNAQKVIQWCFGIRKGMTMQHYSLAVH